MVPVRRRLKRLQTNGLAVPGTLLELLRSPVIVVFAGQSLDPPNPDLPVFPANLENTVRQPSAVRVVPAN